ncbi:class I SAM-dependent methyltransferase [Longitalea arenae]|uniref:class I SAM-dependent methyltransferase n=1 Tax=Longitalea arenae TaxID=2812558 RepID=UPI001968430E|nr:class I SAM-dependent methyltransferase [Longitalea arenae]
MNIEAEIAKHYARDDLYETIIAALGSAGVQAQQVTHKDLSPVDEFHVRGREVSHELAMAAGLQPGMRVLDAGCGLGGACRLLAADYGCIVRGIDISADYIHTAQQLSVLTDLQERTRFIHGSVLSLPFDNNSFDAVWTQHVQMNIADKKAFYTEVTRVLRPGGRFIYYEILSRDHLPLRFPLPWADHTNLSFLVTPQQLHTFLLEAGLQRLQVRDETASAIAFFDSLLTRITQKGLPALGLHLLMGPSAMEKLDNLSNSLIERTIVLESGIYEKV